MEQFVSDLTRFHFQVNDGREQTIAVKTGKYAFAAAAIPAMLDVDLPANVKIWVPRLLPEYGPYYYIVDYDECMRVVVSNAVPVTAK